MNSVRELIEALSRLDPEAVPMLQVGAKWAPVRSIRRAKGNTSVLFVSGVSAQSECPVVVLTDEAAPPMMEVSDEPTP